MSSSFVCKAERRRFVVGAAGMTLLLGSRLPVRSAALSVAALFAGQIDDRGFMESGWRGLERARSELGVTTRYIDNVEPNREDLITALTELAESGADLVIAHGGQNNEASLEVAARFPHIRFAVTQGSATAANLSSYEVLQEESAYLAGVLAASITRTGVVGHMSGIRVRPGLKGRAGFAAGVRDTDPGVRLLTNFSGQQDDNALSRRVALAEIAAGADIIFTMLNDGRDGVTRACRESGIRQIGNVIDWVRVDPQVFVASAVADVSIGVFNAVRDLVDGRFTPGVVHRVGLTEPAAVRLAMADDVPAALRLRIEQAAEDIRSGRIHVPDSYDGLEFATPPKPGKSS
jgi:basic membrane protein A